MKKPEHDGEYPRQPGTERSAVDLPVAEEAPERETVVGRERSGESAVEQASEGVERESAVEGGDQAGVESPPRDADRANLLP